MGPKTKIVFIHQHDSWYLPYALYQARHASPSSEVVLIGEGKYENVTCVPWYVLENCEEAKEFKKIYVHMSPNSQEFELFCFLRWFYLLQYMRLNKVDSVFYFDSDVLLYSSAEEISNIYRLENVGSAFMITRQEGEFRAASSHMSFWTRDVLERFCSFISQCYHQQSCIKSLNNYWIKYASAGHSGGICDMVLLYMFWQQNPSSVANFVIERDGGVFDTNINVAANHVPNEYEFAAGIKKLKFVNSHPMLFKTGQRKSLVRSHALHFQGEAKGHMSLYYRGEHFKGKMGSDLRAFGFRLRKNVRDFLRARGITGYLKGAFRG